MVVATAMDDMRSQDLVNALANAAPNVIQMQPPPAANQSDKEKADLFYKTELCKHWEKESACPYGDKCQFAHGRNQLRFVVRSKKYKTKRCKTFWSTGSCPYGSRCCFLHDPEEDARLLSDMTTFIFDQATGETIPTPNQRGNKPKKQERRRKGSMGAVGESVPESSISTFNQVMGIDPGEKSPGYGGKKQHRGPQQGRGKGVPIRHDMQGGMMNGGHHHKKQGAPRRSASFHQNNAEMGFKGHLENDDAMNQRGKSFSASTFMPGFGNSNLGLNNDWLFSSQAAPESDFLFNAPHPHSQSQGTWSTDLTNLGVGLDRLTLNAAGPEAQTRVGSSGGETEGSTPAALAPTNMPPNLAPDLATNLVDPAASSLHQPGLFNAPSYPSRMPEPVPSVPTDDDKKTPPALESSHSDPLPPAPAAAQTTASSTTNTTANTDGGEDGAVPQRFLQKASNFLLETTA